MALMTLIEVAQFLGVQDARVARLERESLLVAKERNESDEPMFDDQDVGKYKELAERLGGM